MMEKTRENSLSIVGKHRVKEKKNHNTTMGHQKTKNEERVLSGDNKCI